MKRSIDDLQEKAKNQFKLDFDEFKLILGIDNEGNSPEWNSYIQDVPNAVKEEKTSKAIKTGLLQNEIACFKIDSEIETLTRKMALGTVSIKDVFALVLLEVKWRKANNTAPQFRRELRLWSRMEKKVSNLQDRVRKECYLIESPV